MAGRNGVSFEVEGLQGINEILAGIPKRIQSQLVKKIHREALKAKVLPALRAAAPNEITIRDGNTYRTIDPAPFIKILSAKRSKTGMIVGPTREAYVLRFLEFGTKVRYTRGGGSFYKRRTRIHRGILNPDPFIERIYRQQAEAVTRFVADNYRTVMVRYLEAKNRRLLNRIKKLK